MEKEGAVKGIGRGQILLNNLKLINDDLAARLSFSPENNCLSGSPLPSNISFTESDTNKTNSKGGGRGKFMKNLLINHKHIEDEVKEYIKQRDPEPEEKTRKISKPSDTHFQAEETTDKNPEQIFREGPEKTSSLISDTPEWTVNESLFSESFQKDQRFNCYKKACSLNRNPLVLFPDSTIEPVNTFNELPIKDSVIRNLQKGGNFVYLNPLQRWAIPAIRRQHNVVLIGSFKTGKSLSYIISVIDYIQDRIYFDELPDGNGPSVIILCSTSRACESVFYLCHKLIGNDSPRQRINSKIRIVLALGGAKEKSNWIQLTNGCDVLITTPLCLVRLMKSPIITNLERLTCLIVDEIDVLIQDPFKNSVKCIFEAAFKSTKKRYCQKIMCARKWSAEVKTLIQSYASSHVLIIGSYLEAAIYKDIKPTLYLVEKKKKDESVYGIVSQEMKVRNVLVVCERETEAMSFRDFLKNKDIDAYVVHEHMSAEQIKDVLTTWKAVTSSTVLIATDGIVSEVNIRGVDSLVHYGLPRISKTNFFLRYTVFESYLTGEILAKNEKKSEVKDFVVVDDENHYQLPHIVDFIKRLGGKIPEQLLLACKEIRRQIEMKRTESPFCEKLIALGKCRFLGECTYRHVFNPKLDTVGKFPHKSWVNFVVLKVHDVAHFSVKITHFIDSNGEVSKMSDNYSELSQNLDVFFSNEENRRCHGVAKLGDKCAVKCEENKFCRAEVIEVVEVDKHNEPSILKVIFLDDGDIKAVKKTELYWLRQDLAKYPAAAVEVRIVGIEPFDFDINWSEEACQIAKEIITSPLSRNQYWTGRIGLSINNTIFLESMVLKCFLPNVSSNIVEKTILKEFFSRKIAVENSGHLKALFDLLDETGIKEENDLEFKKRMGARVEPEWAQLDLETSDVKFLGASNIHVVFVRLKKYEKLIEDLESECLKEAETTLERIKANEKDAAKLMPGMFCLARFEPTWNRAKIEREQEDCFKVFFVDHGDFMLLPKDQVIPISKKLLLQLPCQAIECRLAGLKPLEQCPTEIIQTMYSFSNCGQTTVYVSLVGTEGDCVVTKGRKHVVNLIDRSGRSLNKILAEGNGVECEESEIRHLVDCEPFHSDEEGEDNEEDEVFQEDEDFFSNESSSIWLKDSLFNNEEAQNFLMNFATNVLKISPDRFTHDDKFDLKLKPLNDSSEKETTVIEGSETEKKSEELSEESKNTWNQKVSITGNAVKKDLDSPKPALVRSTITQNEEKEKIKKKEKSLILKNRENVLTPKIQWRQNYSDIKIKIMLENVDDYHLEGSVKNLLFRCFVGDKFYAVDLRLFGGIHAQLTKVTVRPFLVFITLKKLVPPLWPRLTASNQKQWWISYDVGNIEEGSGALTERIKTAKEELKKGFTKEGVRLEEVIAYSDDEGTEREATDSDDSI